MHVLLRFLTCPFLRVLKVVPPNARLLEIGAGHGAFSVLAADRGARVVAVDPDVRKAPFGGGLAEVDYVLAFDDAVRGAFDAIAIIDVLYKIPREQWDALLARARERLAPGGMLIVKEHDPTARMKNAWNAAQEWLVARVKLTLGESFDYETPAAFVSRLERAGFRDVTARRIDFGYPHPHIVYVGRI